MKKKIFSLDVGGKTLSAEFTDIADQANGSVLVRYGNTVVLATVVMAETTKGGDFFPLTVDYEERFYASGKILGSRFVRREGRPSDEAILSARIVDRTVRPLFDQKIRNEVQVVLTILSIDEDDPDVVSVIAASLAIGTSDIPWNGPVSAVRIGKNKGFHINPNYTERREAGVNFDMVVCGTGSLINMIEVSGQESSELDMVSALEKAREELSKIQSWQEMIFKKIGKEKRKLHIPELTPGTVELFEKEIAPDLEKYIFNGPNNGSKDSLSEISKRWVNILKENIPNVDLSTATTYLDGKICDVVHRGAIESNKRADGRGLDDIRPIYVQAGGISPVLHGSGIFYRGATHILSVLTLGGPDSGLVIDGMEQVAEKRFMHHYNFPPFSTGETGRIGGTNRRMVGHGALAEKALLPVIPNREKFPYTIRLVSEVFASNGSSSMASVCASTIALMDGGVPIYKPVAGIACGLMMRPKKKGFVGSMLGETHNEGDFEYKILTDIQGPEDHYGDMDFKVAGTRDGITAVQMDVKVSGVPVKVLEEAFAKARKARLTILGFIEKEISAPRQNISTHAPSILTTKIRKESIGLVIGGGGKTINEIKARSGVDEITIEDDGTVYCIGRNGSAEKAMEMVKRMAEPRQDPVHGQNHSGDH
jgi:polyribonucleotide nucleotidyltransferase